nr:uncharacterized protein LOC123758107 [Procambarus clarkii]
MDELACSVCSEEFRGGIREPVVLPQCGHTFCRPCLLSLQAMHPSLRCPACRRRHKGASVAHLPTNFTVLNLATAAHANNKHDIEACQHHGDPVRMWCNPCQEPLCGQCLFERHMTEKHHVVKIQSVVREKKQNMEAQTAEMLEYVEEERANLADEVHSIAHHLACIHRRSSALTRYVTDVHRILKDVRKTTRIVSVLANENSLESLSSQLGTKHCNDVKKSVDNGQEIRSSPVAPFKSDICDNNKACHCCNNSENCRESDEAHQDKPSRTLQLVDSENNIQTTETGVDGACKRDRSETDVNEGIRSREKLTSDCGSDNDQNDDGEASDSESEPRVKDEMAMWPLTPCDTTGTSPLWPRIDWTHFCYQLPVVQLLVPPEKPEVFLQLSVGRRSLGRVHIRLWGYLRRAQHFLALCLGTLGPSYKGSRFSNVARKGQPGESLVGCQYRTEGGSSSARGLLEGLEWRGNYSGPVKEGVLGGASDGDPNLEAFFGICTRDYPEGEYYCPFGEVVGGMEVVRRAVAHDPVSDVTITDITSARNDG